MSTTAPTRRHTWAVAVIVIIAAITASCTENEEVSPEPAICTEQRPDFNKLNYEALSRMEIPADFRKQFPNLFENGSLKPWTSLVGGIPLSEAEQNRADVTSLLDMVDGDANTGKQIRNDYFENRDRQCGEGTNP
ncbi:hypothetical protein [Nocardia sp. NPDC050406]|uniref:hypothetical protein n=1 Tax=Nocardia sp. NPDC050406 TaxID=3364318 RepID=UPI00379C392F